MIDPVVQRITNKDGSVDAKQMIQELISARDRIRALEALAASLEADVLKYKPLHGGVPLREYVLLTRVEKLEAALRDAIERLNGHEEAGANDDLLIALGSQTETK